MNFLKDVYLLDNQVSHERILISIAIIICALVIGYNAFFIPDISEPTVVYIDEDSQNTSSEMSDKDIEAAEEYEPSNLSVNSSSVSGTAASSEPGRGLVNINTASTAELESLSNIGNAYANRIIDYRNNNGNFNSIEEIMNVKGIGEKTFEKIKNNICV